MKQRRVWCCGDDTVTEARVRDGSGDVLPRVRFLHGCIPCNVCAPLYLFHGPNGTGKTSTVRVFAMALNCESNNKPCCTWKGCSESLYTMDLCSGNRISGFEKIKTLLQNTSFAQAILGFKVFIIEECHLLTLEAWDELMSLLEGPYGSIGLIPHTKLLDLLAAAVSGDAINTIRYVKKLSECIEPSSFVSQLVNLVTNLLSGDPSSPSSSANRTLLSKTQSARLCYILKLLVETERQLWSTSTHDQTSNIIATTFLDITSMKASNINNIVLPARSLLSTSSQWSNITFSSKEYTHAKTKHQTQICEIKHLQNI
ncbi:P-loop containing nucleoside triphosphate hydrolase [Artemisia annua]|uniref:P-loop containing nucleoside triphosphate hydrolase n=1 Tax=Artemisia annua TaxID=35608 RepID=A0A2U1PDT2_ARTAN|nr:P-loop containing nucleoside triphosphate hydrolase [Artemisia annua]